MTAAALERRSYELDARLPDPAVMRSMTGLDYLRAILRGDAPAAPMAATLNFWPAEFAEGRAVFEGEPGRFAYNPMGSVHGGWAATILDSALGCAVMSALPAGKAYTTVELSVRLVRAISERTGKLRCEANVVHAGGSIATAEARLVDAAGTLYAHGATTCAILTLR